MEQKKSDKANLEKSKGIFTQMGLLLSLGVMFIAFEYTQTDIKASDFEVVEELVMEEEAIPITRQEEPPPPPPPPPPAFTEVLNIVDDDVELDEELELDDMEMDEEAEVEIMEFEEEEEEDDNKVFMVVEKMPSFPGGDAALMKYLRKNVKFPAIAQENGIQGRVYVEFVVNKDGQIVDVKILKGVDRSLDEEAVRVVKNMPPWTPGEQRGKAVRVSYRLPINFTLR